MGGSGFRVLWGGVGSWGVVWVRSVGFRVRSFGGYLDFYFISCVVLGRCFSFLRFW